MLRDLLRRSIWLSAGAVVGRLLPLGVLLVASHRMETRQYASASASYAWVGVSMSLTSMGIATVLTQRLGRTGAAGEQQQLFARALRWSALAAIALAAVVLMLGHLGGLGLFGAALDPAVIVPTALSGAVWSQVVLGIAALNGCHQTRAASLTLSLSGLLQGGGMLLAIVLVQASAQALAWGLLAGNVLALVLVASQLSRGLQVGSWQQLRLAFGSSVPDATPWRVPVFWNTVASASVLPVSFLAGTLVAHGADGPRQLAQYFALEQIHQLAIYFPGILSQALLPVVSRRIGSDDDAASRAHFLRRMAVAALLAAAAGLALGALFAWDVSWLIALLGNQALGPSDAWAVRWMVMNAALALSLSIIGSAFVGSGRIVPAALLNIGWGATFLGLTALAAAQGNLGLQVARFTASFTLLLITSLLLLRWSWRARPVATAMPAHQDVCRP